MKTRDLLPLLPGAELTGDPELEITDVTYDSRRVTPGGAFVAIRGLVADGNQFVEAARKKGAALVISERAPTDTGAWVREDDPREALALASAAVLGRPADALRLVGVTGTNGKTTTSYLIDAALRAAGRQVGLLGTVLYRIGDRLAEAVRTTPEASDLQALFAEMRDAG
jgi:UDP-N-acetylmuramoyl-L-alanyl-D-glutamate--2,6-diaminopimelate ligase